MNGTKIVLLLTIVGLVAASGYLVWKKMSPNKGATDVAAGDDKNKPPEAGTSTSATTTGETLPTSAEEPLAAKPPRKLPGGGPEAEPLEQFEPVEETAAAAPRKKLPTAVEEATEISELQEPEEEPTPVAQRKRVPAGIPEAADTTEPPDLPETADEPRSSQDVVRVPSPARGQATHSAESEPLASPEGMEEPAEDIRTVQSEGKTPTPVLVDIEPEPAQPSKTSRAPKPAGKAPELQEDWDAEELPRKANRPPTAIVDPNSVEPLPAGRSPAGEPTPARRLQPVSGKTYAEEGSDPTAATYAVEPGDNFWKISKKVYGSSRYFQALRKHNESTAPDPYMLKPGLEVATPPRATLKQKYPDLIDEHPADLRGGRRQASEAEPNGLFYSDSGEPLYRVGDDDTLSGIAQKHLGRMSRYPEIFARNRDVLPDTESLKPGMVLKLPPDASQLKVVGTP